MRFVHLTDLHLTVPPDARSLAGRSHWGKRYLGLASWRRARRRALRAEWFTELAEAVGRAAPDQLLVTGDLTQIGSAEEIHAARDWLEALGPPDRVTLVPGNHDVYARDSWRNVESAWGGYLHLDAGGYPLVRRSEGVLLVGLCSARPTPPLSAAGELGVAQLERLDATLRAHADALKIVLLHHPPLPGMIRYRKRLRDAAALGRLLEVHGVALVLHGHQHRNRLVRRGNMHVFCTGPASSEDASFRVFDIDATGPAPCITARLVQRTRAGFEAVDTLCWSLSRSG